MCYNKILIAVEELPLALKTAKKGFELARALKAKVAVVHVLNIAFAMGNVEAGILPNEARDLQEEVAQRMINELLDRYAQDLDVEILMPEGLPSDEVLAAADDWDADLLVVGTHARHGLEKFFLGSVEEEIVPKASCAVLVVSDKVSE